MQKGDSKTFIDTEKQKGAGVTQMSCEDQRVKEAKIKILTCSRMGRCGDLGRKGRKNKQELTKINRNNETAGRDEYDLMLESRCQLLKGPGQL